MIPVRDVFVCWCFVLSTLHSQENVSESLTEQDSPTTTEAETCSVFTLQMMNRSTNGNWSQFHTPLLNKTTIPKQPCCQRVENQVWFGSGEKEDLVFDVGRCQRSCNEVYHRVTEEINGEEENGAASTLMQINHEILQEDACEHGKFCQPSLQRLDRHYTTSGLREITIIEQCECANISETCSRTPRMMRFLPDTPFEKVVDVGKCSGSCSERSYGLNVTTSCGCLGKCYRMDRYDYLYDHRIDENGQNITRLMEINVGGCAGSCQQKEVHHCVLRNPKNHNECLMSLKRTAKCSPKSFSRHFYTNKHNRKSYVSAVDSCECM